MELQPLNCEAGIPWEDGEKVGNYRGFTSSQVLGYIKEVELFGLTGEVMFDSQGFRTNFKLDVMEKFHNRLKKAAIWSEKGG